MKRKKGEVEDMKITKIDATEILDSRGNPTLHVEVWAGSNYGYAIVPSGASTGEFEAHELRDGDNNRYRGKGVTKAVEIVRGVIAKRLIGMDVTKQVEIDKAMIQLDGTESKKNLGANSILGVSLACMYAAANVKNIPPYEYMAKLYAEILGDLNGKGGFQSLGKMLPVPMMNIINGGAHADNNLDVQEFMIIANARTLAERVRIGAEVFHALKDILTERGLSTGLGDEGGFAPSFAQGSNGSRKGSTRKALQTVADAITRAGYMPGKDVVMAMDVAASEFYNAKTKKYEFESEEYTTAQMIDFYADLVKEFPILSLEDALDQNDWDGYVALTKRLGKSVQIVGDDFFCTNVTRLAKGIQIGACNSILIKLNQIGTLIETLECIKMAQIAGMTTVISHRSGESEDTTISDLVVAVNSGQIKTGGLSRTDRVAKYNRLILIEKQLG